MAHIADDAHVQCVSTTTAYRYSRQHPAHTAKLHNSCCQSRLSVIYIHTCPLPHAAAVLTAAAAAPRPAAPPTHMLHNQAQHVMLQQEQACVPWQTPTDCEAPTPSAPDTHGRQTSARHTHTHTCTGHHSTLHTCAPRGRQAQHTAHSQCCTAQHGTTHSAGVHRGGRGPRH